MRLPTWGRRVRVTTVAASVAALIVSATPLAAQDISINFGQGAAGAGRPQRAHHSTDRAADRAVVGAVDPGDDDLVDLSGETQPQRPEDLSMRVLVPAFMISELKRAFEIGFLLFLPFLIIDLVVASVLMSMGMMMLPPVVVSLLFKLIFFVLVDGWTLVAGSLIQSYGT